MRPFHPANLLVLAALALGPAAVAHADEPVRGGAGYAPAGGRPAADAADPALPGSLRSADPATPLHLLLTAGRAEVEDPSRLEPLLDEARARGLRVLVRIADAEWQPVGAWFSRLQSFARAAGDRVDAWQMYGPEAAAMPPREYAYLLKNARVALRAAGSQGALVSLPLGADAAWAEALFAEDAAPYLDILAAADPAGFPAAAALRDRLHPRAPIWITDAPLDPVDPVPSVVRDYLEAASAGAGVILFAAPPIAPSDPAEIGSAGAAAPFREVERALAALTYVRSLFPPRLRPASPGSLPFDPDSAMEGGGAKADRPVTLRVLPFFDAETRDGLAAYRPAPVPDPTALPVAARFTLRAPLESLELIAPATGRGRMLADYVPGGAVVETPLTDEYLVLRYRLAAAAIPVKEATRVGAIAELTAEEIIAREREVRGIQQARLAHYEATATIAIHYRLAALRETVDLLTENRLYVKDGRQDYEQTALYVNGAIWRGRQPPYLPYLQPETVAEVPLDIRLDERYRYVLEGRDTADGIECYLLSFEPAGETGESLYRGRVWVDTRRFTRVRMAAVQTALREPLRSNEVVYRYGPVDTGRGEAWLPLTVSGQMAFELIGYNVAVEREATYAGYRVNEEGFEERRRAAYASGRPLFRETDTGFYGLETDGEQETLRRLDTPRNALLVMGVSIGEDGDVGFPFAGVNFFDFDFRGTGTQFNLAWAGPFADISWNKPDVPGLGRRPWSFAVQGSFNAFETEDKNATAAGTFAADRVDILREVVRGTLAIPVGDFLRAAVETRIMYQNFDRQEDTLPAFVLPPTGLDGVAGLRAEYSRLGWLAAAWGEWGRRARWAPWGLPGQRYTDDDRDYTRIGVDLRKSFYLGIRNKISLGASGFDGRSLDRFSRFELGDFRSARVRGFNDSGIHFDRGLVAEASMSVPLGRSVRADLGLQQGWVHSGDDFGDGYERVLGSGLGLEFSGPWSTFVTVRMSRALRSTIPDKGGGGDLRVVFFRTFDKWSRRGGDRRPPAFPAPPPAEDAGGAVSPRRTSPAGREPGR